MKSISRIINLLSDKQGRAEIGFHLKRRLWPAYRFLAIIYRKVFLKKVQIICVIGSLGKTTTTYALRCALGLPKYKNHQSNAWSALAVQLLKTSPFQKYEVIEVGIGNKGQMLKFAKLLKPNIVVVTSIASEHTGLIGSIDNIRKEKTSMLKLLSNKDAVVFNGDDKNVVLMLNETVASKTSFGINSGSEFRCVQYKLNWPNGMWIEIQAQNEKFNLQTKIFSEHMIYPILASFAVAGKLEIDLKKVIPRLAGFQTPSGRMNVIQLENGAILIRDDYKATYETISPALNFLRSIPAKRRILVLGDSIEMPEPWQESCNEIGKEISEFADFAYFIGEMEAEYLKGAVENGFEKNKIFLAGNNWEKAYLHLQKNIRKGDVVLVKALAFQRIQRFSLALLGEEINCTRSWCEVRSVRCENCEWKTVKNNKLYADKTFVWELN